MTFIEYLTRRTKQFTSGAKNTVQQKPKPPSTNTRQKKDIGEYWLGKTIGRGASGRVKLGIHKSTGEKVAIKMIARSYLVSSITTAKSVQRELAILQLLRHPHLIDLKQVLQDSSYVYFVMEYLEGGELFQVLAQKGKFNETDARRLFYQMVSSLAWCHAHHICHRDLKPENILLDKSKNQIKIADFGMAAMNTNLKTSCGSPHYASPEIIKGKAYDGTCADVWSLGIILYAMISGYLPFDDEHMGRLLGKITTGHYRPLPNSLSTEAKNLIKKMLVVDPSKRIIMTQILSHPWLKLFELRPSILADPLKTLHLESPMVKHTLDLDGRIWETLKVLWRDFRQDEIIHALATRGSNVQKLTYLLLQEREKRFVQDDGKSQYRSALTASSASRTNSANDTNIHSTSTPTSISRKGTHSRHGSDDVGSKCSLATPYDSSMSNVSCTRTIDMPPTPKDNTYDMDLMMEYNSPLKKKIAHTCDYASTSDNNDPCMGRPQQQENVYSPITPITRSRWIYQEQQLTLTPTLAQQCGCNPHHQRRDIDGSPLQQHRSSLLVSSSDTVCLTSLHAEGDIQLRSEALIDTLSVTASTKYLPTTYNIIEQLYRQQPTSSSSFNSIFRSLWSSFTSTFNTIKAISSPNHASVSTSITVSHWWSNSLNCILHPWVKKHPKLVTFDCHGKHECDVAGKIHQILKEQLHGKLSGHIYPNQQIVWNGTLKVDLPLCDSNRNDSSSSASRLWFLCHMVLQHERHFKVSLVYLKGDVAVWNQGIMKLVSMVAQYESEADSVMLANGW